MARRLPLANLLCRGIIAVLGLAFIERITPHVELLPLGPVETAVGFHAGFNILVGLVFLPFTGLVSKLMERLLPDDPGERDRLARPRYLDMTATPVSEGVRAIVECINGKPKCTRKQLVEALGLAEDQVRVITPFVGGGFGGKGSSLQGQQAARLARIDGAPVQVSWTREDEFFWDTFRPAAIVKIRSGLTQEGKPAFWDYRVYFAGARGSAQPYDIPHHRTTAASRNVAEGRTISACFASSVRCAS